MRFNSPGPGVVILSHSTHTHTHTQLPVHGRRRPQPHNTLVGEQRLVLLRAAAVSGLLTATHLPNCVQIPTTAPSFVSV